jgi:hypothetical protein
LKTTEKSDITKLLLWINLVMFFLWFLIFSLGSAKILAALALPGTQRLFFRMVEIFPRGWTVLFLIALRDTVKNLAIVKSGIITAALVIIAFLIYHIAVEGIKSWFLWLSIIVLFVLNLLPFVLKPKLSAAQ